MKKDKQHILIIIILAVVFLFSAASRSEAQKVDLRSIDTNQKSWFIPTIKLPLVIPKGWQQSPEAILSQYYPQYNILVDVVNQEQTRYDCLASTLLKRIDGEFNNVVVTRIINGVEQTETRTTAPFQVILTLCNGQSITFKAMIMQNNDSSMLANRYKFLNDIDEGGLILDFD